METEIKTAGFTEEKDVSPEKTREKKIARLKEEMHRITPEKLQNGVFQILLEAFKSIEESEKPAPKPVPKEQRNGKEKN